MTANQCAVCGKPLADGAYVCQRCGITKPTEQLHAIADMTPAARDIAHGLSRHGAGAASGKPGSQLPLDLGATAKLDGVLTALTKWIDHIGTQRGHARPWFSATTNDHLVLAAEWLPNHLEWMRHRDNAEEFLTDVAACARIVAGIARGPSEQRFLGPCRATVTWDDDGNEVERDSPCDGDVYAHIGAQSGTCRACGARWTTKAREAWLDGEVRAHAYRAAHIAEAYDVSVNTIRSWATPREEIRDRAGKVTQYARAARLFAHSHDREGRPLYLVGDVLDLAAADAARRAGEQAKRARRTAAREAAEAPA